VDKINNSQYLRDEQYKNAKNLNARIRLHVEFSANDYGWFRWVFDQYDLPEEARILELGCGPGDQWRENQARIPAGWQVTLSDFSPGMLEQAQQNLAEVAHPFNFEVINAQEIPYPADSFDAVIANHCIYHFPDRARALSEIQRVLKPGERFYATTIGDTHMQDLSHLIARFEPQAVKILPSDQIPFTLENGAEQLSTWLEAVSMDRYQDQLRVTDAGLLVAYVYSGMRANLSQERKSELLTFFEQELQAAGGVITIGKDSGIFMGRKALA